MCLCLSSQTLVDVFCYLRIHWLPDSILRVTLTLNDGRLTVKQNGMSSGAGLPQCQRRERRFKA